MQRAKSPSICPIYEEIEPLFREFCLCFGKADIVIIADVHSAGEEPIEGINKEALVNGIMDEGHSEVYALLSPANLPEMVTELCDEGDLVVCLGAGTVTRWANDLPYMLRELTKSSKHTASIP